MTSLGYKFTENQRKNNSKAQKKRYEDPEERKKTGEAIKAAYTRPEVRENNSKAQKKRFENPEERKKTTTHGYSYHQHYNRWQHMKNRCYNKKCKAYPNYGGRGIFICDAWLAGPVTFCKWADRQHYKPGLELDRRDNNSGYCPENCRFVARSVNQNNKRNNKKINYKKLFFF
jgi:hypothetical protein